MIQLEVSIDQRYYLAPGGVVIPRVSTVLGDMGFTSEWCIDEARAIRGTACHAWAELVVLDRLPVKSEIPDQARPLVSAVTRWAKEHGVRPLILPDGITPAVEVLVEYHGRYAGRFDLLDDQYRLWDWKNWTGMNKSALYSAGLQTAGYERPLKEIVGKRQKIRRMIQWLQPSADGTLVTAHKPIECKDPSDDATFQAAVSVWHARKRNGLL